MLSTCSFFNNGVSWGECAWRPWRWSALPCFLTTVTAASRSFWTLSECPSAISPLHWNHLESGINTTLWFRFYVTESVVKAAISDTVADVQGTLCHVASDYLPAVAYGQRTAEILSPPCTHLQIKCRQITTAVISYYLK